MVASYVPTGSSYNNSLHLLYWAHRINKSRRSYVILFRFAYITSWIFHCHRTGRGRDQCGCRGNLSNSPFVLRSKAGVFARNTLKRKNEIRWCSAMFHHVFEPLQKISLEKRLGKTREVRTGPNAGDLTYQAEIFVPQGSRDAVNHSGRPRGSLWQTDRLGRPRQRKPFLMLIFRLLMFFCLWHWEQMDTNLMEKF